MGYIMVLLDLGILDDRLANTIILTLLTLSFSFSAILQQQLRNVEMSIYGGYLEWCPIPFSPVVYVRSIIEQQPHNLEMSPLRRQTQGSVIENSLRFQRGSMLEEELHDVEMSFPRCAM